jgi:hypothetical protein
MRPQEAAAVGVQVRVCEDHGISELRGTVGKVVGSNGGEKFVVLDVRFPDGRYQLFWPGDLDDVASPKSWWHCLFGGRKS